jgi:hypothetical protein
MAAQWLVLGLGTLILIGGAGEGVPAAAGFGVLLVVVGALWVYASAPKCRLCNWPYSRYERARSVIAESRGYGIIDRVETHKGLYGDPSKTKEIRRQERVPIITSVVRVELGCTHCHGAWFRDDTVKVEDFSRDLASAPPGQAWARAVTVNVNQAPPLPPPPPPPLIMRRCAFCDGLFAESLHRCPSCGAGF